MSEHPLSQLLPKSVSLLRQGYGLPQLRADAVAGLTVAIVALPLSLAIAMASGVSPIRGLYAAIIGGFLVSLLGGSRHQIGGPAGAFIVLVAGTVAAHGLDGLLLATLMSGVLLMLAGLLGLGTYIRYIPYPVTIGFTAGIALIILASQLKDLFGLQLAGPEPGPLWPKLQALLAAAPTVNGAAVAVAAGSVLVILGVKRWRPGWPNLLLAVVAASVAVAVLEVPVETISSRFGALPQGLPAVALPAMSWARLLELAPVAVAFALLGSIESLLSAVVADSLGGGRHRPNGELLAQGVANIGSALCGGICVTGTIARTATNVRAGAHSPVAGMLHALFLLAFVVLAAPLAGYIPLAALAGLLATVAWGMAERHAVASLLKGARADAVVLMATLLLTVFEDLTLGILVGFSLSALLFLHRMSATVAVHAEPLPDAAQGVDPDVVVSRVEGAFFFGAAAGVGAALEKIAERPRAHVIDLAAVPWVDSTAAAALADYARRAGRRGVSVWITGVREDVRRVLVHQGLAAPLVQYAATPQDVVASR
jgi:sulfate permease, SulP family